MSDGRCMYMYRICICIVYVSDVGWQMSPDHLAWPFAHHLHNFDHVDRLDHLPHHIFGTGVGFGCGAESGSRLGFGSESGLGARVGIGVGVRVWDWG